ncbi:MAG: hypothetical protein AB1345_05695 [Chloroflexota bacterium]
MFDLNRGWAFGGLAPDSTSHVLITNDGAVSFADVTSPEPQPVDENTTKRASGYFLDGREAWVMYSSSGGYPVSEAPIIWHTNDGGTTWSQSSPLSLTGLEEFFTPGPFAFSDRRHGWLLVHVGAGMHHDYFLLFQTTDGGSTWQRVFDPLTPDESGLQSCEKTGLAFADAQNGWITRDCHGVTEEANIAQSSDGGRTWRLLNLPPPAGKPKYFQSNFCGTYSPRLFSPGIGMVALKCQRMEDFTQAEHFLYFTANNGQDWQVYPYPGGDVLFLDSELGWALGRDIFQTRDGGETWEKLGSVTWQGQFTFVDALLGFAIASNPQTGEIALVKTVEGGKHWEIIRPVVGP